MSKSSLPGRCPNCGSTNIQAEPLYPYEDEYDDYADDQDTGDLAVFCVSCGHYLGEMHSELFDQMDSYRQQLAAWLGQPKNGG